MTIPLAKTVVRRPRDPRLDFFRGLAMFIILIAHVPGNVWTLWIPSRFGFSDATEIFVFCSGTASALAFGTVFAQRGWLLGAARVAFRVWQVYWAHVCVFLLTVAILSAIDLNGWGAPGRIYIHEPYVAPFFEDTARTLGGLLTLTYVPGLFDILPMYLAILAMIPVAMALHRVGGTPAVAAAMAASWAGATLAGLGFVEGGPPAQGWSALVQWMNLPADPQGVRTWFFNPFAWQLVFFTGFAFGMGWLKPPPRSPRLAWAAAAVLLASVPFAWFKFHEGFYLPHGSAVHQTLAALRADIAPLWTKTWFGAARYAHFLALAYLAWFAVGPRGALLAEGLALRPSPQASRRWRVAIAAPAALLTAPYAYAGSLGALSPALHGVVVGHAARFGDMVGLLDLVHLAALIVLVWNAAPQRVRDWTARDLVVGATPVVRKVGAQSLAVFMTSIPLSQLMGLALDHLGRNVWSDAAINLAGFAALIAVAHVAAWFKGHPWRAPAPVEAARAPFSRAPRAQAAE